MKNLKCHKNCYFQRMSYLMQSMLIAEGLTLRERRSVAEKFFLIDKSSFGDEVKVFYANLKTLSIGKTFMKKEVGQCIRFRKFQQQRNMHSQIKVKRVLIIGGLDRLENRYCEVFKNIGAERYYHSEKCKGTKISSLETLINKSDLVVSILTANSHNAMHKTKKECKQFLLTQRTGPVAIKTDVLNQITMS